MIRQAIWLYFRLTLSFRDVEEMLAQRGIDVSGVVRLSDSGLERRNVDFQSKADKFEAAAGAHGFGVQKLAPLNLAQLQGTYDPR